MAGSTRGPIASRVRLISLSAILTACGGAVQSTDGSAGPSTTAEPSAPAATATSSEPEASVSESPTALTAMPLGTVDEAAMGYLEYLPPDYGNREAAPLLVFLHGAGEAGDGSAESLELVDDLGIPQLIAAGDWPDGPPLYPGAQPFVVLAPQYGQRYADHDCAFGDDLAAFLDFAVEHYEIDPARVYVTGVSCGAIGMWDYFASHGGELVAASVPVSGHAMWAMEQSGCAPLAEVPTWAFHGAEDEIIPVSFVEEQIAQIRECEGADLVPAELTIYPDTDHVGAINKTYDQSAGNDIYSWLLEHTNDPAD